VQLIIANKNYSSWSLRPWVLMRQFGIAFDEVKLRFSYERDSAFKRQLAAHSPAGRVPVLVDEGFAVWDTLAISEYLAEKFPQHALWPREAKARARARSLTAEMHSGFAALRSHCPMNIEASMPEVGARLMREQAAVVDDLARIDSMWSEQLDACGGPFLFGEFGIADAFYAPVATRIRTYGLPVGQSAGGYIERVFATDAMRAWVADALAERDFLDFNEPYRSQA
jgi:glutathione S-transferase